MSKKAEKIIRYVLCVLLVVFSFIAGMDFGEFRFMRHCGMYGSYDHSSGGRSIHTICENDYTDQ